MMKTVDQVLDDAAYLLAKYGWGQGHMFEDDGRMCAVGAIYRASGLYTEEAKFASGKHPDEINALSEVADEARAALAEVALGHREFVMESVPRWNDDKERTKEDVLLAFKHAAETYRSKEVKSL